MSSHRNTYFPAKTFDDDFERLIALCLAEGWIVPSFEQKQLEAEVAAQRVSRREHDALEIQYQGVHQSFGTAQEARYQMYASVLNALRGAFRHDKGTLAKLAGFTRSVRRVSKKKDTQPKEAQPDGKPPVA